MEVARDGVLHRHGDAFFRRAGISDPLPPRWYSTTENLARDSTSSELTIFPHLMIYAMQTLHTITFNKGCRGPMIDVMFTLSPTEPMRLRLSWYERPNVYARYIRCVISSAQIRATVTHQNHRPYSKIRQTNRDRIRISRLSVRVRICPRCDACVALSPMASGHRYGFVAGASTLPGSGYEHVMNSSPPLVRSSRAYHDYHRSDGDGFCPTLLSACDLRYQR